MKPRKSLSVYVLLVGVMGLLIVGGILAFQVIDEATKSQLSATQKELVKPLDGKLEEAVIENLSKRRNFSKEEIVNIPLPSPEITLPVESSSSSAAGATNNNVPTP